MKLVYHKKMYKSIAVYILKNNLKYLQKNVDKSKNLYYNNQAVKTAAIWRHSLVG